MVVRSRPEISNTDDQGGVSMVLDVQSSLRSIHIVVRRQRKTNLFRTGQPLLKRPNGSHVVLQIGNNILFFHHYIFLIKLM